MKRVFLLVTAVLFVFTLSACNTSKTLLCTKPDPANSELTIEVLKVVYNKESVSEFTEDGVSLTSEELTSLNEDGVWTVFTGAGHYDLMEKLKESYDTNDLYAADWDEESEVPEDERLLEVNVVTCTIN